MVKQRQSSLSVQEISWIVRQIFDTIKLMKTQFSPTLTRPSLEYYAFRRLPFKAFHAINSVCELYDYLCAIPFTVTEPHVARAKLYFFQDALSKADEGPSQHPLIQAVQKAQIDFPISLKLFNEIIYAIEMDIDGVQAFDLADLDRYCERKRSSFLKICEPMLASEKVPITLLNQAGILIERTHCIQSFLREHQSHHLPEDLQKAFVQGLPAALDFMQATASMAPQLPASCKPLRALVYLYHQLLIKQIQTPTKAVQLTALQALFLSLRSLYVA